MNKQEKEKFHREMAELDDLAQGMYYVVPSFGDELKYDFKSAKEYCKKKGKKSLAELSIKEREMFVLQ
jgi:hypothetical protein